LQASNVIAIDSFKFLSCT